MTILHEQIDNFTSGAGFYVILTDFKYVPYIYT